jgi:outer membrane receptor protein involved in Fe transport/copper chaperone CopZ
MHKIFFLVFGLSLLNGSLLSQSANRDTMSFFVAGACEMCSDRIIEAATNVKGVKLAKYDLDQQQISVIVSPDKFDLFTLHTTIANVGHTTSEVEAPKEIYDQLPLCCKYVEENPYAGFKPEFDPKDKETMPLFGKVLEMDENGEEIPVIGANIFWEGTTTGTSSDQFGIFILPRDQESERIIVSYVGFGTDTLAGPFDGDLKILIGNSIVMDEIEVSHRRKSIEVSYLNPLKVESIGEAELLKAACCNLSESFETNPSVDVAFTDAITGTRQIQMLGLAGPNVQIMRENIPDIRGLSALYGFTYTPGPWIEGIQLSKGTGSVVNGFESMTGQINVELRKPEESDRLYLNLYGNQGSRREANLNLAHAFSEKTHTGLMLHGSSQKKEFDNNNDGFLDMPLRTNLIAINRWKFIAGNMRVQAGIKGTYVDQSSGQIGFDSELPPSPDGLWSATNKTKRIEGWLKIGRVFPDKPYKSIGFQAAGVHHDQTSSFGLRPYNATQSSAYFNLIYQSIIDNTNHKVKFGLSTQYDKIKEDISNLAFDREEIVPGMFFEYTYTLLEKFSLVAGIRSDYHNTDGLFMTPRLHMRYAPSELTVFRLGLGKGRRTPSIFAENIGLFASSRSIRLEGNGSDYAYGLTPEVIWNTGFNFTQGFILSGKAAVLTIDFYRTHFSKQVVVDYDKNPQTVFFYPLEGQSYSNSIQAQFDIEILPRFDLRLAYRFNDVRTDYQDGFLKKPLISQDRAFVNIGYETVDRWKFDATLNLQGPKRIPGTEQNPSNFQLDSYSPSFFMLNAQISKNIGERFEAYLGGENLLNFRHDNPIIASEQPFGQFFDASLIWGPVFGRNIYAGIRYRIPK